MKFGFLIDHRKCIGCHACSVACKEEHQVPLGVYRTWVKYVEKGAFPNTRRLFTVLRCNHCEDAPCVTICPVTALYKRSDGIVDFDPNVCIGCKACMQACPYDALYIDPNSNTAAKCNFCAHRVEAGLQPSCQIVCPTQAIVSGDLDDPTSYISYLTARAPVRVRKPEKGTKPQLFYIDADESSLAPMATVQPSRFGMWSEVTSPEITDLSMPLLTCCKTSAPRPGKPCTTSGTPCPGASGSACTSGPSPWPLVPSYCPPSGWAQGWSPTIRCSPGEPYSWRCFASGLPVSCSSSTSNGRSAFTPFCYGRSGAPG